MVIQLVSITFGGVGYFFLAVFYTLTAVTYYQRAAVSQRRNGGCQQLSPWNYHLLTKVQCYSKKLTYEVYHVMCVTHNYQD